MDFFGVKVDGSDLNPGIKHSGVISQIPRLTSLPSTLTQKKVRENDIFG